VRGLLHVLEKVQNRSGEKIGKNGITTQNGINGHNVLYGLYGFFPDALEKIYIGYVKIKIKRSEN
jgi:hypothetical protein